MQRLIDLMFATLAGTGVGLAARQVGVGLRLAVVEDAAELEAALPPGLLAEQGREPVARHVLVNPTLTVLDPDPAEFFEGCLSVDGFSGLVRRHRAVLVRALDEKGHPFELALEGWPARILQHELDHLEGKLYIDYLESMEELIPVVGSDEASGAETEERAAPLA